MKDILKSVIWGGIFTIPFIVLIVSNSMFFPFITGKNFTFRILVEVIFFAWVLLAFYDVQYRPQFSWIFAAFPVLLVVMFFANMFGVNPQQSFWSNFERMDGYVSLVHVYMYIMVVGTMVKTQKVWNRLFNTIIFVAILLSFYAFAQLSGSITINQGGVRLDGTLGNSAYMAIYTLFLFFISLYMGIQSKTKEWRIAYGAVAALLLFLLIKTATRGTAIGLVIGLVLGGLYIALFERKKEIYRTIALGAIVAVVAVVGLLFSLKDTSFVANQPALQRLTSISLSEGGVRFKVWDMAQSGLAERPLLGWGQGNFNYIFNEYYNPSLYGAEAWYDRVHNIVFDWLVNGGVLGLLAYTGVVASGFYYVVIQPFFKKDDATFTVVERGLLLGLLSGYVIHNVFVFDNIVSYIFFGTMLAFIHSRVMMTRIPHTPSSHAVQLDRRLLDQVVTPVVLVIFVVVVYTVNVPGIRAASGLIDAFTAEQNKDAEGTLTKFEEILAYDSFAKQEVREQLIQRVQGMVRSPEVSEETKKRALAFADQEIKNQINETPGDARAYVFAGSFYRSVGDIDTAIQYLEQARALSPKKQLIIYEQGFAHLQKNEFEKGLELFKEAFELDTNNVEARMYYAIAALYASKLGMLDELIETDEQKIAFAMNDMAIQAVNSQQMYPRLIEMFKIRVERLPDSQQERTNLAYILNETGDKAGAIEVLRQAAIDIPTFEKQANDFIKFLEQPAQPTIVPN